AVDEAVARDRRILELPDKSDDGERQHDRREEDALVDARPSERAIQAHGQEDSHRGRDAYEEEQPHQIVYYGWPEERICREQLDVVVQADELDRVEAIVVREGQDDRRQRRKPD